jgi:hypothetical protein
MASAELSRRVGKVVGYPPLVDLRDLQRREFHEALLEADSFEDLLGRARWRERPPNYSTSARASTAASGLVPGSKYI